MASQGPRYPTTAISLANAGTSENANPWVSPTNVGADDATEASITAASFDAPDIGEILVASAFGFTIPAGATIDGITVEIDRRGYTSTNSGKDFRVQLATGTTFATLVGSNKAATDIWQAAPGVKTYGGAADTWTAGLTAAQVNDAGFSVFLSAYANVANADIAVDYIRVTIAYTEAAATNANAGNAAGTTSALTPSTAVNASAGAAAATVSAPAPTVAAIPGLFSDDFESNSLAKWSTVFDTNGAIATGTGAAHAGTYGVHIDEAATAAGGVYIRRTLVASDRIRASGWFRSPTEGAAGNNNANLRIFSGGVRILDVYRQNVTGELWLRTLNAASGSVYTSTGQTRSTATWYQFDILVEYNGAGGVSHVQVWVDGVSRINASTFDLKVGAYDMIQIGAEHPSQFVDLDADEVQADNNPSAGTTVSPGVALVTASALAPSTIADSHANAGGASVTVSAPVAAVMVFAMAGCASATGAANAPTTTKASNAPAGVATVTASALAPTITAGKNVDAGVANASATAAGPSVAANATAGAASITVNAPTPSTTRASSVVAGIASVAATALTPTLTADSHALAGVASVTASAFGASPTGDSHAQAGVAAVTVAAFAPTINTASATNANAGVASVTASALGAVGSPAIAPQTGVASVVGSAQGVVANLGPSLAIATVTVTAESPSVQTSAGTNAQAGVATATATAPGATVTTMAATNAQAGVAAATVSALDPSIVTAPSVFANAGAASVAASAPAPATSVAASAPVATITASALNATTDATTSTNAQAGIATATANAPGPSLSVAGSASIAEAIATAWGAGVAFASACNAGVASASATAWGPSLAIAVYPNVALVTVAALEVLHNFGPPHFMTGGTGLTIPQGTTMRPTTPRLARD